MTEEVPKLETTQRHNRGRRCARALAYLTAGVAFQAGAGGCDLSSDLEQAISQGITTGVGNLAQALILTLLA